MVSFKLQGLTLRTGDLICTANGDDTPVAGQFWRIIGLFVPGEVDHIIIYLGPEGRCIEAGPRGVNVFDLPGQTWDAVDLVSLRGPIFDTLIGASYPIGEMDWPEEKEIEVREAVRTYCLAQVGKPYNVNYFNPHTEEAFYCSQLAYLAYLPHGINLNTELGVPDLPPTRSIIYPQEIWSGFSHDRVAPDERQIPHPRADHSMG
jgi:hypothetical protein